MAGYLLIESRDPFDSNDCGFCCELARGLAAAGNQVTLYLVQNAVLAARPAARNAQLLSLTGSNVRLLADDFSLQERGVSKLADGIESASIEEVVDRLEAGDKSIWH